MYGYFQCLACSLIIRNLPKFQYIWRHTVSTAKFTFIIGHELKCASRKPIFDLIFVITLEIFKVFKVQMCDLDVDRWKRLDTNTPVLPYTTAICVRRLYFHDIRKRKFTFVSINKPSLIDFIVLNTMYKLLKKNRRHS